MSTKITEFHGAQPLSDVSLRMARKKWCPFVDKKCKKAGSGGACSLAPVSGEPVIICPNRLYDDKFKVISDIVRECFGKNSNLITDKEAKSLHRERRLSGSEVIVFGQGYSGEMGISAPSIDGEGRGTFKIDFVAVKVGAQLEPESILAIEVQTIDTTNSYKPVSNYYYSEPKNLEEIKTLSSAGFNWENVSKRILPQLIYKGHALRRERLAKNGLYFVLPRQVLLKIKTRIGNNLLEYPKGPGTVTFKAFELGKPDSDGRRNLLCIEEFTTTVEQLAFAFVSPQNLPPLGVYEDTILTKLGIKPR